MAKRMIGLLAAAMAAMLAAATAVAAINPAYYQRVASHQLHLHETARVVHEYTVEGHRWRRVTLVGTVLEVHDGEGPAGLVGQSVTIDYTVDLDLRERLGNEWEARNGRMPGPQFLAEPDPPVADQDGNFWASLAPLGGRLGNVNRHAGAVHASDGGYASSGAVYVPVAAQYSFLAPMD